MKLRWETADGHDGGPDAHHGETGDGQDLLALGAKLPLARLPFPKPLRPVVAAAAGAVVRPTAKVTPRGRGLPTGCQRCSERAGRHRPQHHRHPATEGVG